MSEVRVTYRHPQPETFRITFGERGYDDMDKREARKLRDDLNEALADVGGPRGLAAQQVLAAALNYYDATGCDGGRWEMARAALFCSVTEYRAAKAAARA